MPSNLKFYTIYKHMTNYITFTDFSWNISFTPWFSSMKKVIVNFNQLPLGVTVYYPILIPKMKKRKGTSCDNR